MGGNPENAVGEEVEIIRKMIEISKFKAKLMSHLLDDVKLDCGSVGFVVDGQKGDAAFMFSDNDISGDDASYLFGFCSSCNSSSAGRK